MQNNNAPAVFSEAEDNIPSYVSDVIKDNRRQNTNLARVRCKTFTNETNKSSFKHLQQRNSEVFTVRNRAEETYDAYEKDIAIVLFYFRQATAFEFTR